MEYLENLNKEQKEAVLHTEGPALILAGAGSGKTRVLIYRIIHLLKEELAHPEEILAITFTNKAAQEMKERLYENYGSRAYKIWAMTFHAACVRILRQDAEFLGFRKNFTIYDQSDSVRLVRQCIDELDLDQEKYRPRGVQSIISTAKNNLLDAEKYAETANESYTRSVALIFHRYQEKLAANNAMDFDDLLMNVVNLFAQNAGVLKRWQARFKYILVDEYQDTNSAQYEIIKYLAKKHKNIFCVGDDDQSIYSWRGAQIKNVQDFTKDFKKARVIALEQNYRSTEHILETANEVVSQNTDRLRPKRLWSSLGEGEKVRLIACASEWEEARKCVDIIYSMQIQGYSLDEMAIFYRTNDQTRVFEDVLRQEDIPYQVIGGMKFYERAVIKDVFAYLRVIDNPDDSLSLKRVINTPRRGIGKTSLFALDFYAQKNNMSLFEALHHIDQIPGLSKQAARGMHEFLELMQNLSAIAQKDTVFEVVQNLYAQTRMTQMLYQEKTIEAEGRLADLFELLNVTQEYAENNMGSLNEFLTQFTLQTSDDAPPQEGIKLMALHSAKGLEFPVVMVVGIEEELIPHSRSIVDNDISEERRLFYVGITRARQNLYLLYAKSRTRQGRRMRPQPSRFLQDLPTAAIEGVIPKNSFYRKNIFQKPQKIITDLQSGDRIIHPKFGEGEVLSLRDNELITIKFDDGQDRCLMLKYAPLEKIEADTPF